MNAIESIPGVENPFLLESVANWLEGNRKYHLESYLAFWLCAGTQLTHLEISALCWEMVQIDRNGRWKICGPIGLRGSKVECLIAPQAEEAMAEFRKERGKVLLYSTWPGNIRDFLKYTALKAERETFQRILRAPSVTRAKRRTRWDNQPVTQMEPEIQPEELKEDAQPCAGLDRGEAETPSDEPEHPEQLAEPSPAILEARADDKPKPRKSSRIRASCVTVIAADIGVSPRWLKDKVKAGELKGYKIGSRVHVDLDSFEAFMASRAMTS